MANMSKAELEARVAELEGLSEVQQGVVNALQGERDALVQSRDALQAGLNDEQAAHTATRESYERISEELAGFEEAADKAEAADDTGDVLNRLSAFMLDIPDDSNIKRAVFAFLDSLVANYKDGPGEPGRNALGILNALADGSDTAYKTMTVLQRASATAAANSLKGAFK